MSDVSSLVLPKRKVWRLGVAPSIVKQLYFEALQICDGGIQRNVSNSTTIGFA